MNQKIQFIQDAILLAVHNWCTIEEAKKRELKPGCVINKLKTYEVVEADGVKCLCRQEGLEHNNSSMLFLFKQDIQKEQIFGLPPTLPRLLYALGETAYIDGGLYTTDGGGSIRDYICDRKLINEDGTDATLLDQLEETIDTFALLLGYK